MAQKLFDKASLVMIPSQYKEGKIYNIKPEDQSSSFEFERATTATRVNSQGLIEKERSNLLLQSNTFSSDNWIKANTATVTGGQAGYDGSSDAWLLNAGTTGSARTVYQSISVSGIHTASIRVKKGSTDFVSFRGYAVSPSDVVELWADLSSTGVITEVGNVIDSKIISLGNGWFELNLTGDFSPVSTVAIYPVDASGSYNADSGDNIYIQDAQLEQGLVATDYIETTTSAVYTGITDNVPRLDYSGTEPALLLEPQRTNELPYSEYFDAYGNKSNINLTPNAIISPDGTQNATRLESTEGTWLLRDYMTSIANVESTISLYVKAVNPNVNNTFRLSTGGNNHSSDFTATDQWQRFEHTATSTGGTVSGILRDTSSNDADLYIWGAQVEQGSYATSYIPTNGQAETRLKDSCKNTNITDFRTTDASIFVEFDYDSSKTGGFRVVFSTENSTASNFDLIVLTSTSGGSSFKFDVSGSGISFSTFTPVSGKNKALIKFERSSGAVKTYLNGSQVDSGTATAIPEIHKIAIGSRLNAYSAFNTDRELGDIVGHFTVFSESLTDSECISLTTL